MEDLSSALFPRCLNVPALAPAAKHAIPELDEAKLPLPFEKLPSSTKTLPECAVHQIQSLLAKERDCSLSAQEEDALDDGFFLCDLNVVRHKLIVWHHLFPRIHPFFAVKCNPDPMVAAVIGQLGGGFDCASVPEIELALAACSNATTHQMIVYANPQRAEQHLDKSLRSKIRALTFDGPEELFKIHRSYQKLLQTCQRDNTAVPDPPSMILRILVPDDHSSVPLGEKFGASPERIEALTQAAVDLNLIIVGVSFHCGSGNHDPASYQTAIGLAVAAIQTINQVQALSGLEPCWLLDIGGGYPGVDGMGGDFGRFCGDSNVVTVLNEMDPSNHDTTAKIGQVVTPFLDKLLETQQNPIVCIAEPGRYFVEGAFALCSRIYRIEESDDLVNGGTACRHYHIAQGVQGVFKDCLLCNESFVPIPLNLRQQQDTGEAMVPSTVHGPSGEEYDVICRNYPLPVLQVGDWLLFDRMGAYTLSIAARNGRPPVRYVIGDTQLVLEKQ
jgi:ornithine decarboxylase